MAPNEPWLRKITSGSKDQYFSSGLLFGFRQPTPQTNQQVALVPDSDIVGQELAMLLPIAHGLEFFPQGHACGLGLAGKWSFRQEVHNKKGPPLG